MERTDSFIVGILVPVMSELIELIRENDIIIDKSLSKEELMKVEKVTSANSTTTMERIKRELEILC